MNKHIFHKVAVVMGGISREREISLCSGRAVAQALRIAGYDVREIDVQSVTLNIPHEIEAVFIALHGEFGEDGQIQQLLEDAGIPYTGAGAEGSKLAFNKALAKNRFRECNIPTPIYEILHERQHSTLSPPVVLKPIRQGSSIGINYVMNPSEWAQAFTNTLEFDHEVLVEKYIKGKELTVGVLGNQVLPVLEIQAPDNKYNFAAKYTKGMTKYLVPAPLPKTQLDACQEIAWQTFKALKCRGFGRIDMRMSEEGDIYVLELNTIPGFTQTSLLPKEAKAAGYEFSELCDRIMRMATLD